MPPQADHERRAAIADAYEETGSLAETGKRFGISRERVRQVLNKLGNHHRYGGGENLSSGQPHLGLCPARGCGKLFVYRGKPQLDKCCSIGHVWAYKTDRPLPEEVFALREAGLTYAAIGRRLGLSQGRVAKLCFRAGVGIGLRRGEEGKRRIAALLELEAQGLAWQGIADKLGYKTADSAYVAYRQQMAKLGRPTARTARG